MKHFCPDLGMRISLNGNITAKTVLLLRLCKIFGKSERFDSKRLIKNKSYDKIIEREISILINVIFIKEMHFE